MGSGAIYFASGPILVLLNIGAEKVFGCDCPEVPGSEAATVFAALSLRWQFCRTRASAVLSKNIVLHLRFIL